ncbi:MAG: hypothetical protein ABFD91_17550 [Anaerohalosphaeraceae bacterium]
MNNTQRQPNTKKASSCSVAEASSFSVNQQPPQADSTSNPVDPVNPVKKKPILNRPSKIENQKTIPLLPLWQKILNY